MIPPANNKKNECCTCWGDFLSKKKQKDTKKIDVAAQNQMANHQRARTWKKSGDRFRFERKSESSVIPNPPPSNFPSPTPSEEKSD